MPTEDISPEDINKLKTSRSRSAGWVTRSIDHYGTLASETSAAILEAIKERLSGQFKKLQSVHDKYVSALTDDDAVDEAEDWMTKYFDKVTQCMSDIDARLRNEKTSIASSAGTSSDSSSDAPEETVDSKDPPDVRDMSGSSTLAREEPSASRMSSSSQRSVSASTPSNPPVSSAKSLPSIDGWIDELLIGEETTTRPSISDSSMNMSEALARLEIERDLPKVELPVFDGSAIMWPRFIEQFFVQVHSRPGLTDSRKMDILQSHVKGEAKRLIQGLGYSGRNYTQSLKELKFAFGHRIAVARAYLNSVTSGNVIVNGDAAALRSFYIAIRDCTTTLQQLNYTSELSSGDVLQRALRRVPNDKRSKWNEYVCSISRKREPTLLDLQIWLKQRVEAEFNPYAIPVKPLKQSSTSVSSSQSSSHCTTLNTSASRSMNAAATDLKSCPACSETHHLSKCQLYTSKSVQDRFELVKLKRLCFNCLYPKHRIADCTSTQSCKVNGCAKRHHTSLHRDRPNSDGAATHVYNLTLQNRVYFQILPVTVKCSNGRCVDTYALLDSGSDISLINADLATDLGLKGHMKGLTVNTLSSQITMKSMNVRFSVRSRHDGDSSPVWVNEAWTMTGVLNCPAVQTSMVRHLDHLKDLSISDIEPHEVKILIGANVPQAHLQLEVRQGREEDPVGIKTPLGWCIMGSVMNGSRDIRAACVNLTSSCTENLSHQVEKFWQTESFGVSVNLRESRSVEDERALNTLQSKTEFINGHYVVPMLWKDSEVSLPNNKALAEKRFSFLRKRLNADPELGLRYSATMQGYISKGYAQKMMANEVKVSSRLTWYLPHHCVINPHKPEKLRVVFDAAAAYEGVSLNSALVTGPDLLNSLFGVLQRFRLRPIAVVADIRDMFHQVHVPSKDSDALRFLWTDDFALNSSPDVYRMVVHIFGAKDSPCCANFALRRVAADDKGTDPLVAATILKSFYVDDLLTSVNDITTAIDLSSKVADLLSAKGFELRKWMSSSKEVLSSIPQEYRANPDVDLDLSDLPAEKALGVRWNVQTDSFVFMPSVSNDYAVTKRGIISTVSAIFDPCGFLTPFTFSAKCLIQELWREKLEWDDVISEKHQQKWKNWIGELHHLSTLQISRFCGFDEKTDQVELHVFCDASEAGFAAVAYLRMIGRSIRCSFIASKSHLAPIKSALTIPKLELQGAVMAVRLSETLKKELDVKLDRVLLWTDAMTVLKYIGNESRRWKIFVANRVSEIREKSHPSQWRHIHTSLNPADCATRGMSARDLKIDGIWFRGPAFLLLPEEHWPEQPFVAPPAENDENLRKTVFLNVTSEPSGEGTLRYNLNEVLQPQRFSSWHGLLRQAAWILRAVRNFASGCSRLGISSFKSLRLTTDELCEAEVLIIRQTQREGFVKDYKDLSGGYEIHEQSSLRPLSPFFDSTVGLLRVGGRLKHSMNEFETKHQLLLPYNHHVTKLLVREEHEKTAHAGPEHVIASLRKKYWPVKCRLLVKQCIHDCFDCRKRSAKAKVPLMANLPLQRVKGYTRPFEFTGIDYFGPLTVKRARSRLKKWGCLFTCLVTRAIHLELADSLESDDFILVLRNFIGRRGKPKEIFSDNGKNFVGAMRELRTCLQQLDQDSAVHNYLLKSSIQWHFIPPNAPHFGGAWERLVKSTKSALKNVLKEQCVSESVLRTVLVEVEDVINSRPLTHNSTDPNDYAALTPNHFLRLNGDAHVPPCESHASERNSRRRWRQSQVLADHLWNRWLSEYLPTLTVRNKWMKEERNFLVNDLVILIDDSKPRGQWSLGRISEVFPSEDGRIRSLKVKTAHGVYIRPSSKVCLLEEGY